MTNAFRHLLTVALLTAASAIRATTFETEILRIDVPNGFQDPVSERVGELATAIAFTKPHPDGPTRTLLQITVYDPGPNVPPPPKDQLGQLASRYLSQFLGGIERRRTNYSATPPTRITLGGLPAARATWSGSAEGKQLHGAMFSVIVGTKILSLHVQDLDTAPPANMQEAEAAVRRIQFKKGG